jgi:hypothetical protein
MNIQPCSGCILKPTCSQRHALSKLLRSGNIKSVNIDCKDWIRLYSSGVRVAIELKEGEDNNGNEYEGGRVTGTITGRHGASQFIVWIDDEYVEKDICYLTRVKMSASRIEFIPEIPAPVCPECGTPEGKIISKDWFCSKTHVVWGI